MPLRVVTFAAYLTRGDNWSNAHYDALDFVRCLKGESIRGRYLNLSGIRITHNIDDAIPIFARRAFGYLNENGGIPPAYLIPVPNKRAVGRDSLPRTKLLADRIARLARVPDNSRDVLRWTHYLLSSREGGSREPENLYPYLEVISPSLNVGFPAILIDDVMTTGGHLRACAAKLRENGNNVILALCAGRTVHEPEINPFEVKEQNLDDYFP